MKCLLCENKTVEERLAATKRLIKLMMVFIIVVVGIVIYEMITMAIGIRTEFSNLGSICPSLGCISCALSINLKRQKEFEAELENMDNI